MGRAQHEFRTSKKLQQLFFKVLIDVGVDIARTFWDHFPLRAVPHGLTHKSGGCEAVDVHRDSWSANIDAQLNWWAPLYPLTPERTMAFCPDYWQRRLRNNTASWSINEYIHQLHQLSNKERAVGYSSVPLPQEAVDDSYLMSVLIRT